VTDQVCLSPQHHSFQKQRIDSTQH
jgi:hypothetical protein